MHGSLDCIMPLRYPTKNGLFIKYGWVRPQIGSPNIVELQAFPLFRYKCRRTPTIDYKEHYSHARRRTWMPYLQHNGGEKFHFEPFQLLYRNLVWGKGRRWQDGETCLGGTTIDYRTFFVKRTDFFVIWFFYVGEIYKFSYDWIDFNNLVHLQFTINFEKHIEA